MERASATIRQCGPTLTSDDVFKRGYLTKQGRVVKSWKKRYFCLRNGALFYYKSPDDTVPLGHMTLFRAKCEFVGTFGQNNMHRLAVITPGRTLYIQTLDMAEVKEWAFVIQKVAILETTAKGVCPPISFQAAGPEEDDDDAGYGGGIGDEEPSADDESGEED